MKSFFAALTMLSIFPAFGFCPTEQHLKRSMNWFPAAGMFFGIVTFGLAYGLIHILPQTVTAMLLALFPEVLTKGFHLDGLADTADGFMSSRSRERKLEIMHDSRMGSMGALAIFAVLGMKFALFVCMPTALLPSAAALSALCGRCGLVWHIAFSQYARKEGLALFFFKEKPWMGMVCAAIFPALAAWLLKMNWPIITGLSVGTLIAGLLWSKFTHSVIGGATGDTLGAFEEISEVLTLLLTEAVCFWIIQGYL